MVTMIDANVWLEGSRLDKTFCTYGTGVWFFSRVDSLVFGTVAFLSESFPTKLATIWLFSCASSEVQRESHRVGEDFLQSLQQYRLLFSRKTVSCCFAKHSMCKRLKPNLAV